MLEGIVEQVLTTFVIAFFVSRGLLSSVRFCCVFTMCGEESSFVASSQRLSVFIPHHCRRVMLGDVYLLLSSSTHTGSLCGSISVTAPLSAAWCMSREFSDVYILSPILRRGDLRALAPKGHPGPWRRNYSVATRVWADRVISGVWDWGNPSKPSDRRYISS